MWTWIVLAITAVILLLIKWIRYVLMSFCNTFSLAVAQYPKME